VSTAGPFFNYRKARRDRVLRKMAAMRAPMTSDCNQDAARAHGSSLQRLVGRHSTATLILGDSETMERIEADALVSDPPYGIGHRHSGKLGAAYAGAKVKAHTDRVIGDDKPFDPAMWLGYPIVILWGADHYAQRLPHGRWLTWDKLGGKESWDSFGDVEHAWQKRQGAARIFRYLWKGMCQGAGEDKGTKRTHPTQKPVCVMRWCLDIAKVPIGATVLDPYMGSGTTGVACVRTGRNFIGIERDAAHYKTACDRIAHELDGALL